ncbi:MAG: hypothetical protein ABSF63_03020 [Candidatus Bathyarchaeia archaeon]
MDMPAQHPKYSAARKQLISFLQTEGFKVHPEEVYCPDAKHCWVDVAALKGQDYWAFEYKSRKDSIKRGLDQCRCYAKAFNFVVLVADRNRATSSPYFGKFKQNGFGVWSHVGIRFHPLLKPKRLMAVKGSRVVVERQFRWMKTEAQEHKDRKISEWFSS